MPERTLYIGAVKALIIVILAAGTAHGAPWTWRAPDACPGEHALEQAVGDRLDRTIDSLPLDVDVIVLEDEGQYTAQLTVHGAIEDSRVLTSASCKELTDALAVVIARLVASLPATPKVAVASPIVPVQAQAQTEQARWNGGLRVGGVFGTGSAPGVGVAGELGGWVSRGSLALAVSGSRWKSSAAMLEGTMSGVDVTLQSFAVRAGWRSEPDLVRAGWRPSWNMLRAWAVGELGSIRGDAIGLTNDHAGSARWSAVGGGMGLAVGLARQVVAVAAAEAEFVLDRTQFRVDSGVAVYSTPSFALHGGLAIEVGWR
jgi:hypothetical protein